MFDLKLGSEPPLESGQYVIETEHDKPGLFNVDVHGSCVWVTRPAGRSVRWGYLRAIRYRRFDPTDYLEESSHAQ